MAKKIYDLAVKVGQKPDGKGRYTRVGGVFEGEHGQFILMERTFNPAGVPGQDERQSIIVSMFKPREDQQSGNPYEGVGGRDDEMPF